jgi:hypothetical protein
MWLIPVAIALSVFQVLWREQKADSPRWLVAFASLYVVSDAAFVLLSGGDWMEGGRMLVPIAPVLIAFLPMAVESVTSRAAWLVVVTVACCAVHAAGMAQFVRTGSKGVPLWTSAVGAAPDSIGIPAFEKRNLVNVRELPAAAYLDRLVSAISRHHTPVVILGGQMGMAAHHVAREHTGIARFVDRWGLTDRTFSDCPVTSTARRIPLGILMSYETYFEVVGQMVARCRFIEPDVIYDYDVRGSVLVAEEVWSARGYTIGLLQDGIIQTRGTWQAGSVPAGILILVRSSLVHALPDFQRVTIHLGGAGTS